MCVIILCWKMFVWRSGNICNAFIQLFIYYRRRALTNDTEPKIRLAHARTIHSQFFFSTSEFVFSFHSSVVHWVLYGDLRCVLFSRCLVSGARVNWINYIRFSRPSMVAAITSHRYSSGCHTYHFHNCVFARACVFAMPTWRLFRSTLEKSPVPSPAHMHTKIWSFWAPWRWWSKLGV